MASFLLGRAQARSDMTMQPNYRRRRDAGSNWVDIIWRRWISSRMEWSFCILELCRRLPTFKGLGKKPHSLVTFIMLEFPDRLFNQGREPETR